MIYTPLLVKNIRIYRIFAAGTNGIQKPRFVSTQSQMVFVVIILTIQVGYWLLLFLLLFFFHQRAMGSYKGPLDLSFLVYLFWYNRAFVNIIIFNAHFT